MTDSFLVSFVWACPKNWRCACCNMKERFHSFKWHQKILFYVHSSASAFFLFFGVGSFMCCTIFFKLEDYTSLSQCVTGRVID